MISEWGTYMYFKGSCELHKNKCEDHFKKNNVKQINLNLNVQLFGTYLGWRLQLLKMGLNLVVFKGKVEGS